MTLLTLSVLLLGIYGVLGFSWIPLGVPIQQNYIVAMSLALSRGGLGRVLAVGASATAPDDTEIHFYLYNGTQWSQFSSHTPQFAQPYEHFELRVQGESELYLGLVINPSDAGAAGLSSILKRVRPEGGEDGWEGSWAFEGELFDFQLDAQQNVRMALAIGANKTLALTGYDKRGWDTYPAGDTWGPALPVASPETSLVSVVAVPGGGGAGNSQFYVGYTTHSAMSVGVTTLSNSSLWEELGTPFTSDSGVNLNDTSLAWGAGAPSLLCSAASSADSQGVLVSCAENSSSVWSAPVYSMKGGVLPTSGTSLASHTLPSGQSVFVSAAVAATGLAILSSVCTVPLGQSTCSTWVDLPATNFSAPINSFQLVSSRDLPLHLAVSYGAVDGTGDCVAAFLLDGSWEHL